MTYLQLVNSVLRKLREDPVASVSDNGYATLIGDFVNLIKEEVEDSANWDILRSTVQATMVVGSYRYALTGTDSRCEFLDVWNDTEDMWMYPKNSKYMTSMLNTAPVTNDSPLYYSPNGVDSNGAIQVDLWPVPDTADVINFNMKIPEATLSDDTDTTSFPDRLLVLGTWAMAISERGEDGGVSYNEIFGKYQLALSDAIALDASHHADEFIMEVI